LSGQVLEQNLLALAAAGGDSRLVARLGREQPSREVVFLSTPRGLPVPARAGRRPLPYHSTVDPVREGERLAAHYGDSGYIVALGLGAAYHLTPLLSLPSVARLLVIERDPGLAKAVLERIDLRSLLSDRRTRLLLEPEPEEVVQILLAEFQPAVHGSLRTVPLRASIEERQGYYRQVLEAVEQAAGRTADDYSVQARFGKRWYLNTLANLEKAEGFAVTLPPVERAAVAGAGPSLERQVQQLADLRPQPFLIATDTSLPALLAWGFTPDLVVSIDCQLASYHHFLQGLPRQVPLLLDLASPPVLSRLAERPLFFASAHPLARYLSARWRRLPFLDTSGGNVAQAAVSAALLLGAREVVLLGLDFSYPQGKPYSRGTYIYPLFRSGENRLAPLEGRLLSFLLNGPALYRQRDDGSLRYGTHQLLGYKRRLEALARNAAARFTALAGGGLALDLPDRSPPRETGHPGRPLSAGVASTDWRSFLRHYTDSLERLAAPAPAAGRFLMELDTESRMLWMTLLPAAASLRESLPPPERTGHRVLAWAREWSVANARRLLDR
jgi:hypothetical protein